MKLGFSARKLKNFLQRLRNGFQDDSTTLLFTTFDITFIKSRNRILPVRTGSWEESGGIETVSVLTISTREASSHFWNWKNEDNRSHKSKKNKKYFFRKNLSRKKAASLAFVSPGKRTPEANDFSLFPIFLESPLFRILEFLGSGMGGTTSRMHLDCHLRKFIKSSDCAEPRKTEWLRPIEPEGGQQSG